MAVSWLPKHRMRPSLSGRSHSLMLLAELRQEPAQLRVLRNSPRAMPLFGLLIMVVTSLRTSRKLGKLQRASACGGPEIRVCRSGLFAPPVILHIDLHGCRSWVFAPPVVVKLIHHVCKTTPFAHVTFLSERHPKSWTELTPGKWDKGRSFVREVRSVAEEGAEHSLVKCGKDTKKRGRRDVSLVYGIPENRD